MFHLETLQHLQNLAPAAPWLKETDYASCFSLTEHGINDLSLPVQAQQRREQHSPRAHAAATLAAISPVMAAHIQALHTALAKLDPQHLTPELRQMLRGVDLCAALANTQLSSADDLPTPPLAVLIDGQHAATVYGEHALSALVWYLSGQYFSLHERHCQLASGQQLTAVPLSEVPLAHSQPLSATTPPTPTTYLKYAQANDQRHPTGP